MKPSEKDKTNSNPEENPPLIKTVVEEPESDPISHKKNLPSPKQKRKQPKQKLDALQNGMLLTVLVVLIGVTLWSILGRYQMASVTANPTPTPTVGYTPGVKGIIATINPTETPAPTPTPTSTFEPLTDEPIMGFVFKAPVEIPSTRPIYGVEVGDWLSDSSEEILIKGIKSLGVLNINTGEMTFYATAETPGNLIQPVWLSKAQGIAYLSWDASTQNLWISKADGEKGLLLADVEPPLIPLRYGQGVGVGVYNKSNNIIQSFDANGQALETFRPLLDNLPHAKPWTLGTTYRFSIDSNNEWMAYYNIDNFLLFNLQTGEKHEIDLGGLWAMNARWSPDGKRLALIVTEGNPPVHFSDLYILNWPETTLKKIEHTFWGIADIVWAPDSEHLLIQPVLRQERGFNILALYITNILMPSKIEPVPIPIEGLSSGLFEGGLSWSPDGQIVLVKYENEIFSAIYKIEVKNNNH